MFDSSSTHLNSNSISFLYPFFKRRGNRMAVRDVTRQLAEVTNMDVSQEEVVAALRRMEGDGVVQLNERAQSIFVRVGIIT